jgi:hypothetical protein
MNALCCCSLDGPILGAYQADLYLRVAVGCESSVEHAQTASLRGSNVYAVHTLCRIDDLRASWDSQELVFRSQLEILVICGYHLQELHLWSSV